MAKAEIASAELIEVIEALSTILTKAALTIEDIASRRRMTVNHMRSLTLHGRNITAIVQERPYLLSLARRMNQERSPIVNLGPMRSLINVALRNVQILQDIDKITIDSEGGSFTVMSLEEAAHIGRLHDEAWIPPTDLIEEPIIPVPMLVPRPREVSPPPTANRASLRGERRRVKDHVNEIVEFEEQ